jgi:hypothetical protein
VSSLLCDTKWNRARRTSNDAERHDPTSPLPAATLNLQGLGRGHTLRLMTKLSAHLGDHYFGGVAMSRFIALGAVLAMLAAGASAKTLKVTKAEVVQHRAVDVVQHRVPPAEPVDPAILRAHRQRFRDEMPLP